MRALRRRAADRHHDLPGLAAVIIALGLSLGWCIALIIASLPITDPITDTGANLLNGIGQVLAGALATYLGARISFGNEDSTPPARDDTTADDVDE